MNILLENVGKRYLRRWIFRGIDMSITQGARLGISGHNGSGKSTLVKVILGALPPSQGTVEYRDENGTFGQDSMYQRVSFAAPYTDLIEELTLAEFLNFHVKFRPLRGGIAPNDMIHMLGDQYRASQYLRSFSSGMKQRVKLLTALLTDADAVILDEPTSNLDEEGKRWFQGLVHRVPGDVTLIIASNEVADMEICSQFIHVPDHSSSSK